MIADRFLVLEVFINIVFSKSYSFIVFIVVILMYAFIEMFRITLYSFVMVPYFRYVPALL